MNGPLKVVGSESVGAAHCAVVAPEVTDVYQLLLRRRVEPVLRNKTLREEARLCARFVAKDISLHKLASLLGIRFSSVYDFLAAWGIDHQKRTYAGREAKSDNVELAA